MVVSGLAQITPIAVLNPLGILKILLLNIYVSVLSRRPWTPVDKGNGQCWMVWKQASWTT